MQASNTNTTQPYKMEKTMRERQRATGSATILAIGTANPESCVYQADMPDFYFRLTNSDHLTQLKHKFKRICEKTMIKKRYFYFSEEILRENPSVGSYGAPSLDARRAMLTEEVPKLAMAAAEKAIKEWGRPVSDITHLLFYTTSGLDMPGADLRLARMLGLGPDVTRLILCNIGFYAGGTVLRVAKDLAENNAGARILAVCVENMAVAFHAPSLDNPDVLLGQALFGDGAACLVIGADPRGPSERPIFRIAAAIQRTVPSSEDAIRGCFREMGLTYHLSEKVPALVSDSVRECLIDAFASVCLSIEGCLNSIFYAVHPGGPAILDRIEEKLGLEKNKLRASRRVLSEYGNMSSPSVLFVLDELRKKSAEERKRTTGEGSEWGAVLGIGPGLTVEIVVLSSVQTLYTTC